MRSLSVPRRSSPGGTVACFAPAREAAHARPDRVRPVDTAVVGIVDAVTGLRGGSAGGGRS